MSKTAIGKFRREWRKLKVEGHAEEVLQALKAKRSGKVI